MKKRVIITLLFIITVFLILFIYFTVNSKVEYKTEIGEMKINAVNSERYGDYLVLYDRDFERNRYGYELLVEKKSGLVIDKDDWVELSEDTYILSGHGKAADFLREIEIGDIVSINYGNVKIERDLRRSSLKKIEIENKRIDDLVNYRKDNLYDIDIEGIESIDPAIEKAIDDLRAYCKGKEIEEEIINDKIKAITELLEYKYYCSIESNAVEGRGMWHRPNRSGIDESSIEGVREFVACLSRLGINMLFVETYWHGMTTYYSPALDLQHPSMANFDYEEYGNDYISALISECHKKGIQVHAWVELLNAGGKNQELPKYIKEDWQCSGDDDTDTRFLDPSNPEVVDYLRLVLGEMVEKYDFDGISYDYIRFSEQGNSETATTFELKREAVTGLVKALSEHLRSIEDSVIISASPYGYFDDAYSIYMQDTREWLEEGYLDVVLPMIYTENASLLEDTANDYDPYSTQALNFTGISPLYNGADLMENQELIDVLHTCGTAGFSLFASQNYITQNAEYRDHIAFVMENSVSRVKAIPPTSDIETVIEAWTEQLLYRCENIYAEHMSDTERQFVAELCSDLSGSVCDIEEKIRLVEEFQKTVGGFRSSDVSNRISEQAYQLCVYLNYALKH